MFRFNPIVQRELLVDLRRPRGFALLAVYLGVLAALILLAYPRGETVDLLDGGADGQRLSDVFFLGQFAIAALMTPSFAAGAIAGEKERKTYEMLLASPLRPAWIVLGKLFGSLSQLMLMLVASVPIVFVCLPLGGVAFEEVVAAYAAIASTTVLTGAIAIRCSTSFKRVSSAMAVSYIVVVPLVLLAGLGWSATALSGGVRLTLAAGIVPAACAAATAALVASTARTLLYPRDVGSQAEEVVDPDDEQTEVIGMYIQRDQFPDKLFAPPRRTQLMEDDANPVYDKEIHAELFSQGTLMLRLVIQISLLLAIPLMAFAMLLQPSNFPLYMDYVLLFNLLASGVFAAGTITSERERRTLELLLTSPLSARQIVLGKYLSALRVSGVLTSFLLWPVLLSFLLTPDLQSNWASVLLAVGVIAVAAVFNPMLAMLASMLVRRSSYAMVATFAYFAAIYLGPLLPYALGLAPRSADSPWLLAAGAVSPFVAVHCLPVEVGDGSPAVAIASAPRAAAGFMAAGLIAAVVIFAAIAWLLSRRERVAEQR